MIKKFFAILLVIPYFFNAQIEGTWKLAQQAGALAVGPIQGDGSWWSNNTNDLTVRACLFDDSITFDANGNMMHYMDGSTYVEYWQGVASDQCGTPVAPHDGSGTYTYNFANNQLTVNGIGAHIGLPRAINGGEITSPADAVSSITYEISFGSNGELIADIQGAQALGWWRFIYHRTSYVPPPQTNYDITFKVNTANITVGPNGMYAGGGVLGDAMAVPLADPDGDGIWEGVTSNVPAGGGNFIFLNSPSNGADWGAKEDLTGLPCADPSNWNDRLIPAMTADTTIEACFGNCFNLTCSNAASATQSNVTFSVDMSQYTGAQLAPYTVYINGTFNNWNGNSHPMNDSNGDGVWETTLQLDTGTTVMYKFTVNGWNDQEYFLLDPMGNPIDSCTYNNSSSGYADRFLVVPSSDAILSTVCFNSCTACTGTSPINSGNKTYVPDDNFEALLEANNMGDGIANNDSVFTTNISSVPVLNVEYSNISNLTGIEDFSSLLSLYTYGNQLTSLDMSQNTALTELYCAQNQLTNINVSGCPNLFTFYCWDNQLTNINVSQNTSLVNFSCSQNQLTSLDVSQNTALNFINCWNNLLDSLDVSQNTTLQTLRCEQNQLTSLDVSQNTALNHLDCGQNQLTSLDVSQNTSLTFLWCRNNQLSSLNLKNGNNQNLLDLHTYNNPNLYCIEVDDSVYSNSNWLNNTNFNLDPNHYFSNYCGIIQTNKTYIPDDNFEAYLETHDASGNTVTLGDPTSMGDGIANNDSVLTAHISVVINLDVSNKGIVDLTGIEDFSSLSLLYCWANQLSSLDVSQNTALNALVCSYNQLTNLDINNTTNLTTLACEYNQLTSLDVSQNVNLTSLLCANNQLSCLNLKNGNNYLLQDLFTLNNPNLFCIEVDDSVYSNSNWLNNTNFNYLTSSMYGSPPFIDSNQYFSNNCNYSASSGCFQTANSTNNLSLQGIMDFTVPTGGVGGKAIHITANTNISDLSYYGIGVANNGGGTDGQEYTFPSVSVSAGDHILLARDTAAMDVYFDGCYSQFNHVLWASTTGLTQNGDDAIELFENGVVIETFGDINIDGTGQPWEYMDSWAYKDSSGSVSFGSGNWIFGGVNCTDGSTSTLTSNCPYPICGLPAPNICDSPTNLNATNITSNSADLSWVAGGTETVWELTWGPQGFATGTGVLVPMLTTNSYNLTGLSANTSYDFYVKADCGFSSGTTNLSSWAGPFNFSTISNTGPSNKTYIPDDNFEAYLESNSMGDGIANNDSVLTANISSVATLAIPSLNISDLTGIEGFLSLQTLYCYQNSINTIDISNNLNLKNLICWNNQINSLDVSQNTALINLNCSGNLISALDVSQNILLDELVCSNNQISSLDVSQNTLLKTLKFQNNQVTSIDVSSNVILEELNCDNNVISTLDVSINSALKKLDCSDNLISNLDVSQNPVLNTLRCHSNLISQLDVSQNPALNIFVCHSNVINSLDLSQNSGLSSFYAYLNQLSSLDVRNGNNSNVTAFVTWGNSSLTCISVDDVAYSTANWTNIDSHTSFSLNCGQDSTTTCDSIIYIYDTIYTTVYDTLTTNIYDTLTTNVFDTLITTIYDTNYVSISVTDTLFIDVSFSSSGITHQNSILVYPNPTNDILFINTGNFQFMSDYTLEIVNSLGQVIFSNLINIPTIQVPLSTIAQTGIYYVNILDPTNNIIITKYLILN